MIKELPSLVPEDKDGFKDSSDEENDADKKSKQKANKKNEAMARCPGERTFFKVLNAELRKAIHFFDKAMQEFAIREERAREGVLIMKKPGYVMVADRWSSLAKSLYKLYKDLLLLETYAIMSYCSFSKILKKHDKMTGYNTRMKFMTTYVNTANFTKYTVVLDMLKRCEQLYNEVEACLAKEGKVALHEDERLFINMIQNLNKRVLDTAAEEGAPAASMDHATGGDNSMSSNDNQGPLKAISTAISTENFSSVSSACSSVSEPTPKEKRQLKALLMSTGSTSATQVDNDNDSANEDNDTAIPLQKKAKV